MRVIGVDGGDEKRKLCINLGAEKYIDYTKTTEIVSEIMRITTYGAHGVLVTAHAKSAYAIAPFLLRPNGTLVAVGLPEDTTAVAGAHPGFMVQKQLHVTGSLVGTLKDVEEALDFTKRDLVHVSLRLPHLWWELTLEAKTHERHTRRCEQVSRLDGGRQSGR
jgi:alcohol dehydrogenase, propanol-preferring